MFTVEMCSVKVCVDVGLLSPASFTVFKIEGHLDM